MDIENGYFLAKFQNKNDYKKTPRSPEFFLYKCKILEEIGGIIDKVAKMDFNTDSGTIGKFAQMAAYVNLDK
ncbi:hypothetical protein Gogos_004929, partial [Gossypium gossypioides]|nr:hypothetical protein [Gossypium gossypioides]